MAIELSSKEIKQFLRGPQLRIVLTDVFKPSVVLRRLKPSEIRLKPSEFLKLTEKTKNGSRVSKKRRNNYQKCNGKTKKKLKRHGNKSVNNQQIVEALIHNNGKHCNGNSSRRSSDDLDFEFSDESDSFDSDYYEPQLIPYRISDTVNGAPKYNQNGEHDKELLLTSECSSKNSNHIFALGNKQKNTIAMDSPAMDTFDDSESDDDKNVEFMKEVLQEIEDGSCEPQNADRHGNVWNVNEKLFGNVCLLWLENQCYSLDSCYFPHALSSKRDIQRNLELCDRKEIEEAQNQLLLKHEQLLKEYFSVFCEYYGQQNYPEYLRKLIRFGVEKQQCQLLKDIVNGFLIIGIKYQVCVDLIMNEMDVIDADDQFSLIWKIILDSRNADVVNHLKKYKPTISGDSNDESIVFINQLLVELIAYKFPSLKVFAIEILKNCVVTTFRRIDSKLLEQFLSRLYASDRTNAESIERRALQLNIQLSN